MCIKRTDRVNRVLSHCYNLFLKDSKANESGKSLDMQCTALSPNQLFSKVTYVMFYKQSVSKHMSMYMTESVVSQLDDHAREP